MKKPIKLLAMLTALLMAQTVVAQTVFSPNVNGMRSHYQNRRAKAAVAAPADKERGFFVVTCSLDASPAAIANQMIDLGGIIRSLMANQILVELPMSQLDAAAAIDGVLLIEDDKTSVQISKVETGAGEEIEGAHIVLTNS